MGPDCVPCAEGDGVLNSQVCLLLQSKLRAFYTQKNCRLNGRLVSALLERQPMIGWSLAPLLITCVDGARDAFLCGEACSHLSALIAQRGAIGEGGACRLIPHVPALQTRLTALLSRDKQKSKHLLPPVRLAQALLKTLHAEPAAQASAAALAAALAPIAKRLQEEAGKQGRALAAQSNKLGALCQAFANAEKTAKRQKTPSVQGELLLYGPTLGYRMKKNVPTPGKVKVYDYAGLHKTRG